MAVGVLACENEDHDKDGSHHTYQQKIESILDLTSFNIDDTITGASPYWMFIAIGDKDKKLLLDFIKECSVQKKKKNEWTGTMEKLWRKYPIMLQNNIIIIDPKFGNKNKGIQLSRSENEVLTEIGDELHRAMQESIDNEISAEWVVQNHGSIIYWACKLEGVPDGYASIAQIAAPLPDVNDPPGEHQYTHYYNPKGLFGIGSGGAPLACEESANQAKESYRIGQQNDAFRLLGYSSHFLSDVGNPMHTGAEYEQITSWLGNDIHGAYEAFVNDNWATIFEPSVKNAGAAIFASSPSESTKNLATYSNSYLNELLIRIPLDFLLNQNKFDLSKDQKIISITKDCLSMTTRYNRGLVRYVTTLPRGSSYKLFDAYNTVAEGQVLHPYSGTLNWNGVGRVYLTGGDGFTNTWADDAFDISTDSGFLTFTRPGQYYEGVPDITSILRLGTNQITIDVRDIHGWSIGYHETWLYYDNGVSPATVSIQVDSGQPVREEPPSPGLNATQTESPIPEITT